MAEGTVRPRQLVLTVKETAGLLKVSDWKIWDLIWKGELPSTKVGRLTRLFLTDVEAYLDKNRRRAE